MNNNSPSINVTHSLNFQHSPITYTNLYNFQRSPITYSNLNTFKQSPITYSNLNNFQQSPITYSNLNIFQQSPITYNNQPFHTTHASNHTPIHQSYLNQLNSRINNIIAYNNTSPTPISSLNFTDLNKQSPSLSTKRKAKRLEFGDPKKPKIMCKCGSDQHFRISSENCPLNKKNINKLNDNILSNEKSTLPMVSHKKKPCYMCKEYSHERPTSHLCRFFSSKQKSELVNF